MLYLLLFEEGHVFPSPGLSFFIWKMRGLEEQLSALYTLPLPAFHECQGPRLQSRPRASPVGARLLEITPSSLIVPRESAIMLNPCSQTHFHKRKSIDSSSG